MWLTQSNNLLDINNLNYRLNVISTEFLQHRADAQYTFAWLIIAVNSSFKAVFNGILQINFKVDYYQHKRALFQWAPYSTGTFVEFQQNPHA